MTNDESEERRCPVCEELVGSITVVGPGEAILSPCGHRVDPHVFDYS